jgi:hypothetical protein
LTSEAGRFIDATLSDLVLAVSPTPEPAIKAAGFFCACRMDNPGGMVRLEEDRRNV